jgi:hypothetical protein
MASIINCDLMSDVNQLPTAEICSVVGCLENIGLENARSFVKDLVDSGKFRYVIFTYIPNQFICNQFNARCLYTLGNRAVYIIDIALLQYANGVINHLASQ